MRANLFAALAARLPLVLHHVLQAHSIDGSNENGRLDLLSRGTIIHDLISILLKSKELQNTTNVLLRRTIIHKRGSITNASR